MPKQLENQLKQSAKKQGLKPGSDRYNAYVYGTLHKVTGEWGIDRYLNRIFEGKNMFDYEPTLEHVHVPMLAIVFSILLLLWYFVFRGSPMLTKFQGNWALSGNVPPGSPDDNYMNYAGWYAAQYNANGAEAGYKTGWPEMYMPYNESV